jgi:hypothetical protein
MIAIKLKPYTQAFGTAEDFLAFLPTILINSKMLILYSTYELTCSLSLQSKEYGT